MFLLLHCGFWGSTLRPYCVPNTPELTQITQFKKNTGVSRESRKDEKEPSFVTVVFLLVRKEKGEIERKKKAHDYLAISPQETRKRKRKRRPMKGKKVLLLTLSLSFE